MKQFWQSVKMDVGYNMQDSRMPYWVLLLLALIQHIWSECYCWFWRVIMHCQHPNGHYHSEDWAGPESGGMAGYCDRCGFSFHHTLY